MVNEEFAEKFKATPEQVRKAQKRLDRTQRAVNERARKGYEKSRRQVEKKRRRAAGSGGCAVVAALGVSAGTAAYELLATWWGLA